MALSISLTPHAEPDAAGDMSAVRVQFAHLILDSSHPAGGYVVTPSRFGFTSRLFDIVATQAAVRKYYYGVNFDPLNNTLRVFSVPAAGSGAWTEVTATQNLSGVVVRAAAIGY